MFRPTKIGNIDRFSSLPDEIAHKIIESVSTTDISRLSVVSKRCRQLCLSTPFFGVDDDSVQHNPIKRAQLMNYVDRVLCLREAKHIPIFKISWHNLSGEEQEYRLHSWSHRAALCNNAAEIQLFVSLDQGSNFTVPSTIVSCKSLVTLRVGFLGGIGNLKIPSSAGFSSLKCLMLYSVRIDDSFFNWISRCCKRLENLRLVSTHGTKNITIASPSLKFLGLHYPNIVVHLQVYAQKLQLIDLILLNGNTPEWTEPKLFIPNIQTFHKVLLNKTDSYVDLHELRNKSCTGLNHNFGIIALLRTRSTHLRCLRIFGDSVQKMFDKRLLPNQLPNVSEIILGMTPHNVEIVSLMASFLEGTPNLEHLIILGDDGSDRNIETIRPKLGLKNFPILPKLKDVIFVFPFFVQKLKYVLSWYLVNSSRKIDVTVYSKPTGFQKKASSNATMSTSLPKNVSVQLKPLDSHNNNIYRSYLYL